MEFLKSSGNFFIYLLIINFFLISICISQPVFSESAHSESALCESSLCEKISFIPFKTIENDLLFSEIFYYKSFVYLIEKNTPSVFRINIDKIHEKVISEGLDLSFLHNQNNLIKRISYTQGNLKTEIPLRIESFEKSLFILDGYDGRISEYTLDLKWIRDHRLNHPPDFQQRFIRDFQIDKKGLFHVIDSMSGLYTKFSCLDKLKINIIKPFISGHSRQALMKKPLTICVLDNGCSVIFDSRGGFFFFSSDGKFLRSEFNNKKKIVKRIRCYKNSYAVADCLTKEIILYDDQGVRKNDVDLSGLNVALSKNQRFSDLTDFCVYPNGFIVLDAVKNGLFVFKRKNHTIKKLETNNIILHNEHSGKQAGPVFLRDNPQHSIKIEIEDKRVYDSILRFRLSVTRGAKKCVLKQENLNIIAAGKDISKFSFHSFGDTAVISFKKPKNIKESFFLKLIVRIDNLIRMKSFYIK